MLTHLLLSFSNICGFNWTYRALRAFPALQVQDRSRYTNWEPTSVGVHDMRAVRDIRLDLRVQDRSLYNNWAPISVGVRDMRAVRYVRQPFWTTLSSFHFPGVNCGQCVTCVQCAKRSPLVQMSSRWCAWCRVVPSALPSLCCVAPISGNFIMKDLGKSFMIKLPEIGATHHADGSADGTTRNRSHQREITRM